ncbi:hypothetical protein NMY22_g7746 [Coprinellus aureogranulatus]|nr:hypothetical protein NMY22_g7746 [Coprinellus aureogranulatus]
MALSTMAGSPPYPRDKDHGWHMVQGVLFEIPTHRLVLYSHQFATDYSITSASKAQRDHPPGDPRWFPVVINVDLVDFRGFLKALYPKYVAVLGCSAYGRPFLLKEEWLSVLKLSTMWFFRHFRKMAIENLGADLDTMEKILFGTEYHVSSWLVEGYRELIVRPAHPTIEEGEKIGFPTVMTLWGIRDSHKAFGFPAVRTADSVIEENIYIAFQSELEQLRQLEHEHLTPYDKQRANAAQAEKERLVKEARLKEEERERKVQEAASRKRRRKERSSMGSAQESLALIRPSHSISAPARPISHPPRCLSGTPISPPCVPFWGSFS